jgi:predicted nucleotidyltransferase
MTALNKLRNTIVCEYKPDKIILFGSRVWGKCKKDSDYDLFILKKGARKKLPKRTGDILRMKRRANISLPVDAIVYNQSELDAMLNRGSQFYCDIISRGKVLYEKQ